MLILSSIHWTLDVIKAHKHRIYFAIEIAIRISFLLNFKQCELLGLRNQTRKKVTHEAKKRQKHKKNGDRTVKENKNNHEIVVNLVVSHWRLSVFIQEISSFFATKLTLWSKRKHHPNIQKIIQRRKKEEYRTSTNKSRHTEREECAKTREKDSKPTNDPRDAQSKCICVIVYITLLCWKYLSLARPHAHTNTPATATN